MWTVQKCKHYDPENLNRRQPKKPQLQKNVNRYKLYTPEDDALIRELRGKGVPCGEIADKLGWSRSSIYRRIARLKEVNDAWAKELVGEQV